MRQLSSIKKTCAKEFNLINVGLMMLFFGFSLNANALTYVSQGCTEAQFISQAWPHLVLNEPMIQKAYDKIIQISGTSKVQNCRVTLPQKHGKTVDGIRTVVLDQQFYKGGRFHHHGLKIEYLLETRPIPHEPMGVDIFRDVTKFYVCRTPTACNEMKIP